ncbi:MAG TPA: tRNA (adenosine(37)-N6)-threonylcarbamoyltransferase complex ATPase subunit type 1 TsaE [Ginsengibacter sp.]
MEFDFNIDEIQNAAKKITVLIDKYRIIGFIGELGAGKTTLINAICLELGVKENVTSPTYSIIQEYHTDNIIIYHMDLYRIKSIEEAIDAGIEDCLNSNNLCLVEWPQKARLLFPKETVYISLQTISGNTRKLIVELPQ